MKGNQIATLKTFSCIGFMEHGGFEILISIYRTRLGFSLFSDTSTMNKGLLYNLPVSKTDILSGNRFKMGTNKRHISELISLLPEQDRIVQKSFKRFYKRLFMTECCGTDD